MKKSTNLAIVQESAIHLDVKKSLEKAIQLIQQAAAQNAELIVFGESWLSGYPVWLDHCPDIARWNHNPTKKVFARMYQNSVEVGGIETQRLCQMALENKIVIVMGMNEIVQEGFGMGQFIIHLSLLIQLAKLFVIEENWYLLLQKNWFMAWEMEKI